MAYLWGNKKENKMDETMLKAARVGDLFWVEKDGYFVKRFRVAEIDGEISVVESPPPKPAHIRFDTRLAREQGHHPSAKVTLPKFGVRLLRFGDFGRSTPLCLIDEMPPNPPDFMILTDEVLSEEIE